MKIMGHISLAAVAISIAVCLSSVYACPADGQCDGSNCLCCVRTDIDKKQCRAINDQCNGAGAGFSVSCGSCLGTEACNGADGTTVMSNSCIADKNSFGHVVEGNSYGETCHWADRSTIWSNSCHKSQACYRIEESTIYEHSCQGRKSCWDADLSTIGKYSCRGDSTCSSCKKFSSGENSCNGNDSCREIVGQSKSNPFKVGRGACNGSSACQDNYGACDSVDSCKIVPSTDLDTTRADSYQSKKQFEANGGICADGTKPKNDIPEDTCVGDAVCYRCAYYIGCLPQGSCNIYQSPDSEFVSYEPGVRPPIKSYCKFCHVRSPVYIL